MKRHRFYATFSSKPTFVTVAFLVWSMMMFAIGGVTGSGITRSAEHMLGISQSQASPLHLADSRIIRLDRERLDGNNLGEFSPYEPESGNLVARGYDYFYSGDEEFGVGVWESKPGEMSYSDLAYYELMYVLDGSLVMTDESGKTETFGPGEGLVLPKGWSGTLAVPEGGVRKIWVSYLGGKKGP